MGGESPTRAYNSYEEAMPRIAPVTGKSDVPAEHHVVDNGVVLGGNIGLSGDGWNSRHGPLLS